MDFQSAGWVIKIKSGRNKKLKGLWGAGNKAVSDADPDFKFLPSIRFHTFQNTQPYHLYPAFYCFPLHPYIPISYFGM
ncbi:MAG: hypothetical protein ABIR06_23455 [Cyclobacteriaceae bacterium]